MEQCTELEWAVQVLVNNFDKYSSHRCCCKKPRRITKKEFRKMLSHELNHMLTVRPGRVGPGDQLLPLAWGPTLHPACPGVSRSALSPPRTPATGERPTSSSATWMRTRTGASASRSTGP